MAASRAGARRVARVNRNHFHAREGGFVFEKAPQLSESPIRVLGRLRFLNRSPLANMRTFFDRNRPIRVFSLRDKLFRDTMVHIALIAALPAAKFLEPTLCGARADALQDVAAILKPLAVAFNLCTSIALTVTICSDISYPEVNANGVFNFFGGWFKHFADSQQKEIAFVVHEVGLALSRLKQLRLTFAALIRNPLTAGDRPDSHKPFFRAPRQDSIVKGESGV